MSRIVSGTITSTIHFHSIYVEDDQSVLDALFPDGWEGEMLDHDINLTEDREESNE